MGDRENSFYITPLAILRVTVPFPGLRKKLSLALETVSHPGLTTQKPGFRNPRSGYCHPRPCDPQGCEEALAEPSGWAGPWRGGIYLPACLSLRLQMDIVRGAGPY